MATSKKNSKFNEPGETEPSSSVDYSKTNKDGYIDPLNDGQVIEKQNIRVTGDASKLSQPIPGAIHNEPVIDLDAPPPFGGDDGQAPPPPGGNTQGFDQQQEQGPPPKQEREPFNQEYFDMSDSEKDPSAEQLADTVIYGYCELKMAIPQLLAISERRLKKMHEKGEINIYARVQENPYKPDTISLQEFVQRWNKTLLAPFVTKEEWKAAVRPLLIIIFKRNGIGFTPEQQIGLLLIVDLVQTIRAAVLCAGDRSTMMDRIKIYDPAPTAKAPVTPDIRPQPAASDAVQDIVDSSKTQVPKQQAAA